MNNWHHILASFNQELIALAYLVFLYTGISLLRNERTMLSLCIVIAALAGLISYIAIWFGLPTLNAGSGISEIEMKKVIELDQFYHNIELFIVGFSLFLIALLSLIRVRKLNNLNRLPKHGKPQRDAPEFDR